MDYARQQRDPTRHMIGITFVVLVHVLVIYALMTGLARKAVEVIKKPLDRDDHRGDQGRRRRRRRRRRRSVEQPQGRRRRSRPYVPPPDIPVPTTHDGAGDLGGRRRRRRREPHVIAPPPAVVAPPPPPPKPAVRRGIARLCGDDPSYPREAIKAGVAKGHVVARLQIDEKGNVTDVNIVTVGSAAACSTAVSRRAQGLEVPGRGREVRRRGRVQLHAEGRVTAGTGGTLATGSRPPDGRPRRFRARRAAARSLRRVSRSRSAQAARRQRQRAEQRNAGGEVAERHRMRADHPEDLARDVGDRAGQRERGPDPGRRPQRRSPPACATPAAPPARRQRRHRRAR